MSQAAGPGARRRGRGLVAAAVLVVLALVAGGVALGWSLQRPRLPALRGSPVDPPQAAPDFTLVDQEGRPFTFSSLRGRAVLMYFGYTFCPDVCPTTMAVFRQVHDRLGADAEQVRFLFVSVDPERDTPARLREYLQVFGPFVTGVTGQPEQVRAVLREWGIFAEKEPSASGSTDEGYLVSHTASVFLVDPQGNLRDVFLYGTSADDMVHDVRAILGQPVKGRG